MAVERLKGCENIVALTQELGVHRRLLYKWRDQLEAIDHGEGPAEKNPGLLRPVAPPVESIGWNLMGAVRAGASLVLSREASSSSASCRLARRTEVAIGAN